VAPSPDYKAAASRHCKDAQHLVGWGRWANADHLAGIAAECALKAILLGYLGATLTPSNFPVHPQASGSLSHVNRLWNQLPQMVSGRTVGPGFTSLIAGTNPFATWAVDDRYSDGNAITEGAARTHVHKAQAILGILEQAMLTGAVP
jgi:hypothetical protein